MFKLVIVRCSPEMFVSSAAHLRMDAWVGLFHCLMNLEQCVRTDPFRRICAHATIAWANTPVIWPNSFGGEQLLSSGFCSRCRHRCKVNDGNLIWGFEAAFHWMRSSAVLLLFSLFARLCILWRVRICFRDLFWSSASLACNSIYLTSRTAQFAGLFEGECARIWTVWVAEMEWRLSVCMCLDRVWFKWNTKYRVNSLWWIALWNTFNPQKYSHRLDLLNPELNELGRVESFLY